MNAYRFPLTLKESGSTRQEPHPQPLASGSAKTEVNEPVTGTPLSATSRTFVPKNQRIQVSEQVEGPLSTVERSPRAVSVQTPMRPKEPPLLIIRQFIFHNFPIMNQYVVYAEPLHASVEKCHSPWDQWVGPVSCHRHHELSSSGATRWGFKILPSDVIGTHCWKP